MELFHLLGVHSLLILDHSYASAVQFQDVALKAVSLFVTHKTCRGLQAPCRGFRPDEWCQPSFSPAGNS